MKTIYYKIELLSPVLMSTIKSEPNAMESHDELSGTSVLGFLANRYIHEKAKDAHENENFYNWFLKGDLQFSNATIIDQGHKCEKFPMSIQYKKENEFDIQDMLFHKDTEQIQRKESDKYSYIENGEINFSDISKHFHFHHKRDRERGSSEEGQIYHYESLDAGLTFGGEIKGNEQAIALFKEWFNKERTVFLGRSKNSQYGKAKMTLDDNALFQTYLPKGIGEDKKISMTLLSDVILYNENGFSSTSRTDLERYLGKGIEVKKVFQKAKEVRGYHSVWKMPKPSDVCLKAGSSYLLKVGDSKESLQTILENGLGERCNEGFGRVVFGLQKGNVGYTKVDEEKKINDQKAKVEKPKESPPEAIQKLIQNVIENMAIQFVKNKAMENARELKTENMGDKIGIFTRLKSMIKEDGSINLDSLEDKARKNLEKCRLEKEKKNLYEHIESYKPKLEDVKSVQDKDTGADFTAILQEFTEVKFKLDLEVKMRKTYFNFLFISIRNKIKKQKGELK